MFCSKCGKEIDIEALICVHCGVGTEKYRQEQTAQRTINSPNINAPNLFKNKSTLRLVSVIIPIILCILTFAAPMFTYLEDYRSYIGRLDITGFNTITGRCTYIESEFAGYYDSGTFNYYVEFDVDGDGVFLLILLNIVTLIFPLIIGIRIIKNSNPDLNTQYSIFINSIVGVSLFVVHVFANILFLNHFEDELNFSVAPGGWIYGILYVTLCVISTIQGNIIGDRTHKNYGSQMKKLSSINDSHSNAPTWLCRKCGATNLKSVTFCKDCNTYK
ncbi:MAG: zinc ribbon domain-containing protein [Oscillospiraceae bacterium]|jgi:fumarate reductase subunit D|nr:zinc ribbon domain-containing protein [Oscillospiraceae bacterium]